MRQNYSNTFTPSTSGIPEHLLPLIPTHDNAGDLRQKIVNTLKSIHASRAADLDSLAQDIFFEAWTKQIPVTTRFIKHRYINNYRFSKTYTQNIQEAAQFMIQTDADIPDVGEMRVMLTRLFSKANVKSDEISVIHQVFHCSRSYSDAAKELGWSENKVRTILTGILTRMKIAGRIIQAEDEQKEME